MGAKLDVAAVCASLAIQPCCWQVISVACSDVADEGLKVDAIGHFIAAWTGEQPRCGHAHYRRLSGRTQVLGCQVSKLLGHWSGTMMVVPSEEGIARRTRVVAACSLRPAELSAHSKAVDQRLVKLAI